MKRFLLFVAFVLIFLALGISDLSLLHLKDRYPDMRVVFYTKNPKKLDAINDGIYNQIHCSSAEAVKIKKSLNEIDGLSVSFEGGKQDIQYIIDYFDAEIIFENTRDGILYIYGYSKLILTQAVLINNSYINIQLALRKGVVTAGTPIILGSY